MKKIRKAVEDFLLLIIMAEIVMVFLFAICPRADAETRTIAPYVTPACFKVINMNGGKEIAGASGFFINNKGLALTCYHAVEEGFPVAELSDGRRVGLNVVRGSIVLDIAVLVAKVESKFLPIRSRVFIGEDIIVSAYPLGIYCLTEGSISGEYDNRYIISAPISPGSSGGAVVDRNGWVVGMVRAYYAQGQNMNEVIPAKVIRKYLGWSE